MTLIAAALLAAVILLGWLAHPGLAQEKPKAALQSLVELQDAAKTGTIDLYFGPAAPAGKEGQWIKTNPGQGLVRLFTPLRPGAAGLRRVMEAGGFRGSALNCTARSVRRLSSP